MYRFSAELGARLVWAADADGAHDAGSTPLRRADRGVAKRRRWRGLARRRPSRRSQPDPGAVAQSVRTGEAYSTRPSAPASPTAPTGWRARARRRSAARRRDPPLVRHDRGYRGRGPRPRRRAARPRSGCARARRCIAYTLEMSQQIAWTAEADGSGLVMSERYEELTGLRRPGGGERVDPSRRPRPGRHGLGGGGRRRQAVRGELPAQDEGRQLSLHAGPRGAAARRGGQYPALVRRHRGRPRAGAGRDRAARRRGALPARRAGHQRRRLGP